MRLTYGLLLALAVVAASCGEYLPTAPATATKPPVSADSTIRSITLPAIRFLAVCDSGEYIYQPEIDGVYGGMYLIPDSQSVTLSVSAGVHTVGWTVWGGPGGAGVNPDTMTVKNLVTVPMDCEKLWE